MTELNRLFLLKKLLSTATITGCCGGLFVAALTDYLPGESIWMHMAFFIILVVSGVLIGSAAKILSKKDKGFLIRKNENGDMLLTHQRIYLLTPAVMVLVYFILSSTDIQSQLAIAFLAGGIFILGISGGIFNQFTKGAKKLIAYGMIPLAVSFSFILLSSDQNLKQLIWLMGFMYLMCALITSSTVQLNSKIFGAKDINLKNSKKIRVFNYSMVMAFSLFCITAAFYRKLAAGIRGALRSGSRWLAGIFMKLADWVAGDTSIAYADPSEAPEMVAEAAQRTAPGVPMKHFVSPSPVPANETTGIASWFAELIEKLLEWLRGGEAAENLPSMQEIRKILDLAKIAEAVENGEIPPVTGQQMPTVEEVATAGRIAIENILLLVLFVFFLIIVILLTAFAVRLIKKSLNVTVSDNGVEIIEYDEENEIIKTENGIIIRKRYKFTRKGLAAQTSDVDKIRYLYGFILERLHKRKLSIKYSDTPEEIHHKIHQYANGEKLDEIGFNELTEKYRKVRYGNKSVSLDSDPSDLAEKYEKAIEIIEPGKLNSI